MHVCVGGGGGGLVRISVDVDRGCGRKFRCGEDQAPKTWGTKNRV